MNNPLSEATKEFDIDIPNVLPHSRVYQIQVGSRLFKLSGASLSSDSPSYFTEYFSKAENQTKVLFIDRSPDIFEFISSHLQGYYVLIDDPENYTYLASDAFYFGLKRLAENLTKDYYFIRVGNMPFRVPKLLIHTPGNYPNYISINNPLNLNSARMLAAFDFLRPPPTRPIDVPHRSGKLFSEIMELFSGNTDIIKDDNHRALLIKECRYYRFLELEQRIVKYKLVNNVFNSMNDDIILNLIDIAPKGISIPESAEKEEVCVQYSRPFIAREPKRDLIIQIDSDGPLQPSFYMNLNLNKKTKLSTVEFTGSVVPRLQKLLGEIVPPQEWILTENQGLLMAVFITSLIDCHSVINGMVMKNTWTLDFLGITPEEIISRYNEIGVDKSLSGQESDSPAMKKRKIAETVAGDIFQFKIIKSMWKVTLLNGHPKFICVSFKAVTDQSSFTKQIDFL